MSIEIGKFERYLKTTSFSEATISSYLCSMRHYSTLFSDVSTELVQEYRKRCIKTHKPRTVNLRLCALQQYAKFMGQSVEIRQLRIQDPLFAERLLTEHDYKKVLSYVAGTDWYIAFRMLACTGLRISESYQISVGDLKGTRKTIIGKGNKVRVVWFPLKFRQDVYPLLAGKNDNEPVMKWKSNYVRIKLRYIQNKLKLSSPLSPHDFRHLFARKVYAKTKDIYLIKDLLGHRNIQTTMRYLKVTVQSISKRISGLVDW